MRLPQDIFEWGWFVLFLIVCIVRKTYERRAGDRSTLRGMPVAEAVLMIAWGVFAGVAPLLLLFTALLDPWNYPFDVPWAVRAAGLLLFAAAIWLVHRSHADLGRLWSPTVEFRSEHRLVTDGVYRRVRHPMYTAHVLWGISQALLLPNSVAGPPALILMLLVLQVRVPREERAMLDHFGDEYRTYVRRTGRVLPKLRRG